MPKTIIVEPRSHDVHVSFGPKTNWAAGTNLRSALGGLLLNCPRNFGVIVQEPKGQRSAPICTRFETIETDFFDYLCQHVARSTCMRMGRFGPDGKALYRM